LDSVKTIGDDVAAVVTYTVDQIFDYEGTHNEGKFLIGKLSLALRCLHLISVRCMLCRPGRCVCCLG
jgi:hypothetical protein